MSSITISRNQQSDIGYKPQLFPATTFVITNPISALWKIALGKFPNSSAGDRMAGMVLLPVYAPYGHVSYALSVPCRIIGLAKDALLWVASFFGSLVFLIPSLRDDPDLADVKEFFSFSKRSIVFAGSIAEVIVAGIGCAAPIVGYSLDEWLQTNRTIFDHNLYNQVITSIFGPVPPGSNIPGEYQTKLAERQNALDPLQNHYLITMLREAQREIERYGLNISSAGMFGQRTLTHSQITSLFAVALALTFINEKESHSAAERARLGPILNGLNLACTLTNNLLGHHLMIRNFLFPGQPLELRIGPAKDPIIKDFILACCAPELDSQQKKQRVVEIEQFIKENAWNEQLALEYFSLRLDLSKEEKPEMTESQLFDGVFQEGWAKSDINFGTTYRHLSREKALGFRQTMNLVAAAKERADVFISAQTPDQLRIFIEETFAQYPKIGGPAPPAAG